MVKGKGRNPESLPCPARGGAQPVEVGDFSFKEGGGGIIKEQ